MNNKTIKKIVGLGVLTAVVVVLQMFAGVVKLGVFQISLVLIPIVVGSALYGALGGAWLGLAFGTVVLLNGDAAAFLAVNAIGTIITVIVKGAMAGLAAGLVYTGLAKVQKNKYLPCVASAICAPIVNTGIFLIGCRLFFYETISAWAEASGFESAGKYMIIGLVGVNFVVELAVNLVLSPTIFRLINIGKKEIKA